MTNLVLLMLVFLVVGIGFLLVNLTLGRFLRPARPNEEKETVYECGEPAVGPAWVQFDLRFYVVALLFVIFDVEMAFFFPWATVFGGANRLADPNLPVEERIAVQSNMTGQAPADVVLPPTETGHSLAMFAFADILVFFGVLMVGFVYLWYRGDLEWVRSTAGQVERDSEAGEK